MPDAFDSAEGMTHSYGDGCDPPHAPVPQDVPATAVCGACGAEVNAEVRRTTTRLLASLDPLRRQRLADAYAGQPPDMLCAVCMNGTVSSLNQAVAQLS